MLPRWESSSKFVPWHDRTPLRTEGSLPPLTSGFSILALALLLRSTVAPRLHAVRKSRWRRSRQTCFHLQYPISAWGSTIHLDPVATPEMDHAAFRRVDASACRVENTQVDRAAQGWSPQLRGLMDAEQVADQCRCRRNAAISTSALTIVPESAMPWRRRSTKSIPCLTAGFAVLCEMPASANADRFSSCAVCAAHTAGTS